MKKILIYSNLAGNANTPVIEDYLSLLRRDHDVYFEPSYYRHDSIDHSLYDLTLACIDTGYTIESAEMNQDVSRRIKNITEKGTKLVLVNLWESTDQIKHTDWYTMTKKYDPLILDGGLSFFWWKMYHRYKNHEFNFDHSIKNFDFLYLNKTKRTHKDLLFDKLNNLNLLTKSLKSYHSRGLSLDRVYEIPDVVDSYPRYGRDREIYEKQFNETSFNIVSETSIKEKFFTEKIWKPIIAGQPFIVHGCKHYLKTLRRLGFETYSEFFDEGYDEIDSWTERTDRLITLCQEIQTIDKKDFYKKTKQIREDNTRKFFDKELVNKAVFNHLSNFLEKIK